MPPVVSPTEFLSAIWGDSEGFAELTAIGKRGVIAFPWTYPGGVDSLLAASVNHNKTANVYMGVCLRGEKWPRASGRTGVDGKPIIEHRGTEANALLSWTVWVEFDFLMPNDPQGHKGRVVDPEVARKMLADFPLKPSIIVRSGGGIQVYYLLKEAATGDELWRVKAINKALVEHFTIEVGGKKYGADTQSVDLARILRIPGSMNMKYTPPRPCTISWWHPENRYLLDDFDLLPVQSIEKSLATANPTPGQSACAPSGPSDGPPKLPWIVLPQDSIEFISEHVRALWAPGIKHDLTLRVAGMLAHANISLESASAIIKIVSDATGSDTEKRVKDVKDTYDNYVSGREITGRTALEDFIKDHVSEDVRPKVMDHIKFIANRILKLPAKVKRPPKPPNEGGGGGDDDDDGGVGGEPDFQIRDNRLVKFDSRPARWTVTIRPPEGGHLSATVETVNFVTFRLFKAFFFEQTHCMLSAITQRRWDLMIGACEVEVKETPKEARPEGAIETALDEFLSESHENPELGILNHFPGFDESSRFFRFMALKDFMREQGLKIEDRTVFEHLKHLGYKSQVRRFGLKLLRVWMTSLEGGNGPQNGNGHGDGPGGPPKPEPPVQGDPGASAPLLFDFNKVDAPKEPDSSIQETSDQVKTAATAPVPAAAAAEIVTVPDPDAPAFPAPGEDVSFEEEDFGQSSVENE
jgi:hypothetical protein